MNGILIAALVLAMATLIATLALFFRRARRAQRRFEVLAEIAEVSDTGGSLPETLEAICNILVPDFADFCAIDVIGVDGVERAAVRVGPGGPPELERQLAERKPSFPERMASDTEVAGLRPRFFEHMSDADMRELAHDQADLDFLRTLRVRSAITVALRARGKPTGALTVGVAWSNRRYRGEHAEFANVLSGRVALSLDNAGLFSDLERAERAKTEIAETLQHGLLPPPLPDTPGWSVAAMYRPAGAENEIGGDFYDVFPIAGGWMVVLGDVTGHGAHAASIAAQARYTLRTAASLTGDPLVALSALNRALLARGDAALCSVAAVAVSDDRSVPLRLAVAGHPPPLLVDGAAVTEAGHAGPVLGATPDAVWTVEGAQIGPGQQLVIVTDGITEASGPDGRFGEERLHAELAAVGGPGPTIQQLELVHDEFAEGRFTDDAAVLAIAPLAPGVRSHELGHEALIADLFDAFNRRDPEAMAASCDQGIEFFPVTSAKAGRKQPYVGAAGLREYLDDVGRLWEELLITPSESERQGDLMLVRGRAYLRSRELGIRDVPAAWLWTLRDGRLVRGEVFSDPEEASKRFNLASGSAAEEPRKFQAIEHG